MVEDTSKIDFSDGYDDVLSLPSDERDVAVKSLKEVAAKCHQTAEDIERLSFAYEAQERIKPIVTDCKKSASLYDVGSDSWKELWLGYYKVSKILQSVPGINDIFTAATADCAASANATAFKEAANLLTASYEAEITKQEKARIAEENRRALEDKKTEEAQVSRRRERAAQEARLSASVAAAGFKGLSNVGITGLVIEAQSGKNIQNKVGYVFRVSYSDMAALRLIQIDSAWVHYSMCENCPVIRVSRIPDRLYVEGQVIDANLMYVFDGVTIFQNVIGGTTSALVFRPVKL